jgi:hypothetical protein
MISELETKVENWLFPEMFEQPCKDIQITLTKEFCENYRNNRRHCLFMMVLSLVGAYSIIVIGMSLIYCLHFPETSMFKVIWLIGLILIMNNCFGIMFGAAWATTRDFGKGINKLIKEEKNDRS